MSYATLPDHMTECKVCTEAYTSAFDKCPNGCIQEIVQPAKPESPKQAKKGANSGLQVLQAMNTLQAPVRLCKKNGKPKTGRNSWSHRGLTFDSKDEALRYGYLADMQAIGVIRHLRVQPKSVIRSRVFIGNTKYYSKAVLPSENYTPDYAYIYNGMLVIEDVKGAKVIDVKPRNKMPYKRTIPYSKPSANRSHKHLMARYEHKQDKVLFMLVVLSRGAWHYYQASQSFPDIDFNLEAIDVLAKAG